MESAHVAVLGAALGALVGCGPEPTVSRPAPAPRAADHRGDSPPSPVVDEPSIRPLAEYPEPWEGTVALGGPAPETRRRFVVSARSAICPTREQAERRECGHSAEFVNEGLRLGRGDAVRVVGERPFDGHWRALRYQLEGTLPSWIRADDLAERPDERGIAAFDARPDVASATAVDAMTAEQIARLELGTRVRWSRTQGITLAGPGSIGEAHRARFVYVPTDRGAVAVAVEEDPNSDATWASHHEALVYGGELSLDYVCEPGGHCDRVSIVGFVTPYRTAPPDDPEGEWPDRWTDHMPIVVATAMADRFGTFEMRTPGWAEAYAPSR